MKIKDNLSTIVYILVIIGLGIFFGFNFQILRTISLPYWIVLLIVIALLVYIFYHRTKNVRTLRRIADARSRLFETSVIEDIESQKPLSHRKQELEDSDIKDVLKKYPIKIIKEDKQKEEKSNEKEKKK